MPALRRPLCATQHAKPSARDALIAIYDSTNGAGWADNSGWNGAPWTECSWYGTTCDGAQSHVTQLALSANNLSGPLPSLADLTQLQSFNVNDDNSTGQSTGPIPALAGLTNLQYFIVDGNQLTGDVHDVPNRDNRLDGHSTICPRAINPTSNANWDRATGETLWYQNCMSLPDVIFKSGFDP